MSMRRGKEAKARRFEVEEERSAEVESAVRRAPKTRLQDWKTFLQRSCKYAHREGRVTSKLGTKEGAGLHLKGGKASAAKTLSRRRVSLKSANAR